MDAREVDRQAQLRWAAVSRLTQRNAATLKQPGRGSAPGRRAWMPRLRHRAT